MIEIHFELLILTEDLKSVHEVIKKYDFDFPVFFIDLEEMVKVEFVSDYEEYEFVKEIGRLFKGYELKEKLTPGKNDIKLKIHRYHSPFSTDGWGRPIEDPLNETFFLVKKSSDENQRPKINPEIIVSYKQEISTYYVNMVPAEKDEEKGFQVLKDFENNLYGKTHDVEPFNRLNRRLSDSYSFGLSNLKEYVYEKIKASKKKGKRKLK